MTQHRKGNRAAEKRQAATQKLRRLAARFTPDTEPDDELYEHVAKMVEAGDDDAVVEVIDDESLSVEAAAEVELALEEAGYRLFVGSSGPGRTEPELGCLVPFALLFIVTAPPSAFAHLPTALPDTVTRITREKWLRQALGLGNDVSLMLDSQLYHVDHPEWSSASAVRRYLRGFEVCLARPSSTIPPLTEGYALPPRFSSLQRTGEPAMGVVPRVLCGVVLVGAGQPAADVEAQLFEKAHIAPAEELQTFIGDELAAHGLTDSQVLLVPAPAELQDVPWHGLSLERSLELGLLAENARRELGSAAGVMTWRLAVEDSENGPEVTVRAQAPASASGRPLFTCSFVVAEEIETVDEALEDVAGVAREHGARAVMPGASLPRTGDWRTAN